MKTMLAVVFMLIVGSFPAWAALGDNVSSVVSDQTVLHGTLRKEVRAGYNLHQITTSDGSVVSEFVSPAGKVFGVSWQGHSMPNLQQLLGSYATQLQQGQRTQVIPRRGVTIQGADFVFSSFGRLRSFRGRAYAPSLVPGNVTAEVVQ